MRITDLFIKRPVLALVVNLLILLAGLEAVRSLNVSQYPRSDLAVISINTIYVGANADLVRGFVTSPLEHVVATADGIDYIESASSQSLSTITVHLKLNYDPNAALTQLQAKIAQVRNELPPEAQAPVIGIETTDNQFASMYLSFYSNDLTSNEITDFLTRVIQPKLTAINGVQRADILGGQTFAMRIWLKPDRMAALNISPTEVRLALQANNYLAAIGSTKGSMVAVNLVANTNLQSVDEFKQLVIRQQNGTIVRLGEIANVALGAESYDGDVRFDGQKATFVGIWVLPTANSLDVIKNVRKILPEIQAQLPVGVSLSIPYDSTIYIQSAIHEVIKTLIETLVIVIIVVFLFLGSWRSVLIPVIAIPISLVGAAFLMLIFGFSLNLLTLLAIVLSVGLVVDDAIVVVENVERHLQNGLSPMQAAYHGARELVGPIIAMTITLAAVYAPIGIQGGLTGVLFREFAFTLAGAVVVSGVVALTLSPMMCSQLLRAGDEHKGFAGWIHIRFQWLQARYANLLSRTLQYRPITLTLAAVVILFIFPFYLFSGKELAPKEDKGIVFGIIQAAPNSTLDQTVLYASKLNEALQSFPEREHIFQITQPTSGFVGMVIKPWKERKRTTEFMVPDASKRGAKIPGVKTIMTTPAALPGGSSFPVEFVITTTADPKELVEFAQQFVQKAYESKLFLYVDTDLKYDLPQSEIQFDRDKVASLGLNLQQVGADLSTMLSGNYVNRFSIDGQSYKVIPAVVRKQRLSPEQLQNYYVTGPNHQLIPLATFAIIKNTTQPRQLNRFQQLNSAKIQAVIPPGVTLDKALSILETQAHRILPGGYSIDYAGEARQLRHEGSRLVTTLFFALILIFLVLAAQFESFREPFIILLGSVPLALSGALLFTFLGGTTINIYSQVGLITLIGLVAKNGILIVDFANTLQITRGFSKLAAIVEAATTRLRPILMTSVATVAGHFPLVIARGPGAGARNSIGVVLVTGMIIGTIFTLFVVPAIYMLIAKDRSQESVEAPDDEDIQPNIGSEQKVAPQFVH